MTPTLRGALDPTTSSAPAAPLLVLGPSLGTTAEAWTAATTRLTPVFRVLRYDLPGHGASPVAEHPFTVAELASGVLDLIDRAGGGRFSYAGDSLGGAIGFELALGPGADRLDGLALICSDAFLGAPDGWLARAEQARRQGTASLVAGSSERWFARGFFARAPEIASRALQTLIDEVDDEGYARCCEALATYDRRADLDRVQVPVLVLHGDADPVVTSDAAEALAAALPDAHRVPLSDTGHQPQLERPAEVAAALLGAFAPSGASAGSAAVEDTAARVPQGAPVPDAQSRYDAGMAVRREVLSDPYVDAAVAGTTAATAEFQRFITEYAWGGVWTRPGLDRRMRSAVTIASLVTGHHWHELALHLRAALRNGVTRDELVEILLQTAVYAGVPAANSAFGVAKQVFAELEAKHDATGAGDTASDRQHDR